MRFDFTDKIFEMIFHLAVGKIAVRLILAVCLLITVPSSFAQQQKEWTIIAYIDGDNNLDPWALQNFHNMENGVHDQINVIALLDRSKTFNNNPQLYSGTKVYFLRNNPSGGRSMFTDPNVISSPQLLDLGELDLSSPKNITNLIQYAVNIAPARHYAFISWNHGAGWRNQLNDIDGGGSLPGKQYMTIQEYATAIKNATSVLPNKRFDLIIFDQCLMGQLDVLNEISSVADYAVASPPVKWAVGPNYADVFKFFNGSNSVKDIAKYYVDNYIESVTSFNSQFDASMSAYDLSAMDEVTNSLKALINNLNSLVHDRYMEITRTLGFSSHLLDISTGMKMGHTAPWSVNVRDWISKLESEVPGIDRNAVYNVRKALDKLILKDGYTIRAKSIAGAGIYLPLRREFLDQKYFQTDFAHKTGLAKLLAGLYQSQEMQGNKVLRFENIEVGKPVLLEGKDGSKTEHFKVMSRSSIKPLSKNVIKFDVIGENILWTHIKHYQKSGNRKILNYEQLVSESIKDENDKAQSKFVQASPKYNNGKTSLMRELVGLTYMISNGTEAREITITNTSTSNDQMNSTSSGWAMYTDPTLYGNEVLVKLDFNNALRGISGITSYDSSGTNAIGNLVFQPNARIRPRLSIIDDSGNVIGYDYSEPLDVPMFAFLTLGLQKDQSVVGDILEAETISGKRTSAQGPEYKIVLDSEQMKFINSASTATDKDLLGRFALNQYATSGNEVNLLPNFRIFNFFAENGKPFWTTEDSNGQIIGRGTFMYVSGGGIPQLLLYDDNKMLLHTLYLFLDRSSSFHQWYAIQAGPGTRYLLVPIKEFSGDPLEGEWRSDTEIWKFSGGTVNYQRLKKGEEITADGTYFITSNMIRVKGLRFDEYAFYVDHERNSLHLISRDGHLSILTGSGKKMENSSSADNGTVPVAPVSKSIEGVYISGADTGNAKLTITRFSNSEFYNMFLETKGQGNIVCNFTVNGKQFNAVFPNGSKVAIGYKLEGNSITLFFPNMPPLNLHRR